MEQNSKEILESKLEPGLINQKSKSSGPEIFLTGIPSSHGMGMGSAVVLRPESIIVPSDRIMADKIPDELSRFDSALNDLLTEFNALLDKVRKESQNVVAVLETNLVILQDPILIQSIRTRIEQGMSVENSVIQEFDIQIQFLKLASDAILRERAIELEHIKERFVAILRNRCVFYAVEKGSVVVAQSLTPTDLVNFKEAGISGIITEVGGIASHTSILARSFEIPAVIGVKEALDNINDNDTIIIDGYAGEVIVNPNTTSVEAYQLRRSSEEEHKAQLGKLIKLEAKTADDRRIKLMANVDYPADVEQAAFVNADGIGLIRSEHLIISKGYFPSEEEQYEWYSAMANRAFPYPITIRAFDVGSDKFSEGMPRHEDNPALGLRGIRFLLQRPDLFKTQIRAILRSSHNKNVKLMLPMITRMSEVEAARALINRVIEELTAESVDIDKKLPVGIMIETPAAAMMADSFARFVDFFSIGTNDLTQYTLAVDRTNELVSDIYDSLHPAILRMMRFVVEAAHNKGLEVSVCGELAGHTSALEVLVGMGIDELSVSPSILLEVKDKLMHIKYKKAAKLVKEIMRYSSFEEIKNRLRQKAK